MWIIEKILSIPMKYIDKLIKVLKTDRNTFFTYTLFLVSAYFFVDRLMEMLLIMFTGTSSDYLGPFQYTLILACPAFAFAFSGHSKFVYGNNKAKLSVFYVYVLALYVIGMSMITTWFNKWIWLFIFSLPNAETIITQFAHLIKPALSAFALYFPLITFYPVFKYIFYKVNDVLDINKSIYDYKGINLSPMASTAGPYSCEIKLCTDRITGKAIKIIEPRRFEGTLICGVSGSGKTTMIFEPLMARDLERKNFFIESGKEMGFAALRTGIASLEVPYNNEYINKNFSLNMLKPVEGKEKIYRTYMSKLIYTENSDQIVYKNLGFTSISPDYETTSHILQVADNYNIPSNIIDPSNPDSIGMNPFVHTHAPRVAIMISSILKSMYATTHPSDQESFMENVASQAVANLVLLLKIMYPRLHEGLLPNLEDLLMLLNDFDLAEDLCEKLRQDPELAEQYKLQIGYFKKNFYKNSTGRADTERFVYSAITELDNLLRYPGVKNILCNRTHNIDFDKVLSEGQINLICTRRGDLGATAHKAFGLFSILLMQYSVLNRPGVEKDRVPHFLYIDEFPDFISSSTEALFTQYRKYRVGSVISIQNIGQLGPDDSKFKQIALANSTTKVVFGNNTPDDNAWWSKEIGDQREWKYQNDYDTETGQYSTVYKNVDWRWKEKLKPGQIGALKFKECAYKTKDIYGKTLSYVGIVDFLESKYKEKRKSKSFDFTKFGAIHSSEKELSKPTRFNPQEINMDEEEDPIRTNTTDSRYFFDNEDAISFDFGKKKNNN
ncbi:MAG: TraM recognition domain-containing protein [Lachnospiraceae bacterium]|jgi:hypothetical protein|nr:TraM recognition domain-containing protein [Lachnospiraceae bacterium]